MHLTLLGCGSFAGAGAASGPALPSNVLFLYKCDDGHGATMVDATGRGNDLTPNTIPITTVAKKAGEPAPPTGFSTVPFGFGCMISSIHIFGYEFDFHGNLHAPAAFSPILTATERTTLHNSGSGLAWPFGGDTAIQDKALFAFKGDEADPDNAVDSSSHAIALDGGGFAPTHITTGPTGHGWQFPAGHGTALYNHADPGNVGGGLTDFELDLWVNLSSHGSEPDGAEVLIAGIANDDDNQWAWYLAYTGTATKRFMFLVGGGRGTNARVLSNALGNAALSTNYHINCRYDYAANRAYLRVNDDDAKTDSVYPVAQPTKTTPVIASGYGAAFELGGSAVYYEIDEGALSSHFAAKSSAGTDLQGGNKSYSRWLWFKYDTAPIGASREVLAGFLNVDGHTCDWAFWCFNGDTGFVIGDGNGGNRVSPTLTTVADTGRHLIIGWVDTAAQTVNFEIDRGTIQSASYSGVITPATVTFPFTVGAGWFTARGAYQFNGTLDCIGGKNGVLTTQEKNLIWNGGSGTETLP